MSEFALQLKQWRHHRGLSQLDLSSEAGVSLRHVSFLETGKSKPSQPMVLRLLDALDVPLRDRNGVLLAAGFAPVYSHHGLEDEEMGQVRRVVGMLLRRHEPFPAYAMDVDWNLVDGNQAFRSMLASSVPDLRLEESNMLRLVLFDQRLRSSIVNWRACAAAVVRRVEKELLYRRGTRQLVAAVEEARRHPELAPLFDAPSPTAVDDLMIPVSVRLGGHVLHWITTLITFGAPLDVTVDELVIECFFPADETTERLASGQEPPQ